MTTPLFLLRCMEIGISVRDLDYMTIGLVLDCFNEKARDGLTFETLANQNDFDLF